MNHVELRVSQSQIDVYATDAGTTAPLKHIAVIGNANLTLTRGLVSLDDALYNADKAGRCPSACTRSSGTTSRSTGLSPIAIAVSTRRMRPSPAPTGPSISGKPPLPANRPVRVSWRCRRAERRGGPGPVQLLPSGCSNCLESDRQQPFACGALAVSRRPGLDVAHVRRDDPDHRSGAGHQRGDHRRRSDHHRQQRRHRPLQYRANCPVRPTNLRIVRGSFTAGSLCVRFDQGPERGTLHRARAQSCGRGCAALAGSRRSRVGIVLPADRGVLRHVRRRTFRDSRTRRRPRSCVVERGPPCAV